MCLIKKIFIDNDCISSFLWIGEQNLLPLIYPDCDFYVPKQVYDEINKPIPGLKKIQNRLNESISKNIVKLMEDFEADSEGGYLYLKLISTGDDYFPIGPGEAAAIVHCKVTNGILASNNLKDIKFYTNKYGIPYITTEIILLEAKNKGIIDESLGNKIWSDMLNAKRKLPYKTFTECLSNNK